MTLLSPKEIRLILGALAEKYGAGYSDEKAVGQLQAKLSIMLERETRAEKAWRDAERENRSPPQGGE